MSLFGGYALHVSLERLNRMANRLVLRKRQRSAKSASAAARSESDMMPKLTSLLRLSVIALEIAIECTPARRV